MTRRVAQRFRRDLISTSSVSTTSSWRHWCFIETLRRTVFLVHIINVVSARLRKQDPFYYESLNDGLVSLMPLPAPAVLWDAESEASWLAAKASLHWPATTEEDLQRNAGAACHKDDRGSFAELVRANLTGHDLPDTGNF